MQTFMPEDTFLASARVLDNKRLGKQRVEAKQVYLALTDPDYGWKHHPAVKMWAGHESALLLYGYAKCEEWVYRGHEDSLMEWFESRFESYTTWYYPPWMCDQRFHLAHQSNLMRKDPEWYSQYYSHVPNDIPYFWPTKEADYVSYYAAAVS
jgi:hypothetical protein